MATFMQENLPKLIPNDPEGSMRKLHRYVESLNENLAYMFGNLGGDNFNTQDMTNFVANLGATNIITQTIISNSVVTKSLYAERGDIAQLTVDWLSTSKKVMKYLNKDTTDDDYIEIHEQGIELKSASVVMSGKEPLTEELFDRNGQPLYWQKDITYAEIIDGFPYVNGKQIYMDNEVTDYPVRVYQYTTTTKMRINFEMQNGENVPSITMGNVSITDKDVNVNGASVADMAAKLAESEISTADAQASTDASIASLQASVVSMQASIDALTARVTARVTALETPEATTET